MNPESNNRCKTFTRFKISSNRGWGGGREREITVNKMPKIMTWQSKILFGTINMLP